MILPVPLISLSLSLSRLCLAHHPTRDTTITLESSCPKPDNRSIKIERISIYLEMSEINRLNYNQDSISLEETNSLPETC